VKLSDYLSKKLLGSSIEVVRVSDAEMQIKAGDNITLKILIDAAKKTLDFTLFSPSMNRIVTFEEINGVELLDVRLEEELKSSNHEAEEEDAIIAIDLMRMWAKDNGYAVSHVG
jgi:hypothetical protein